MNDIKNYIQNYNLKYTIDKYISLKYKIIGKGYNSIIFEKENKVFHLTNSEIKIKYLKENDLVISNIEKIYNLFLFEVKKLNNLSYLNKIKIINENLENLKEEQFEIIQHKEIKNIIFKLLKFKEINKTYNLAFDLKLENFMELNDKIICVDGLYNFEDKELNNCLKKYFKDIILKKG